MRSITCSNDDGYTLTFGEDALQPFVLASVEGIYTVDNNVTMTDNTMSDGATYQGSRTKRRNIVITVIHDPSIHYAQMERNILSRLFKKDSAGLLVYTEDGVSRKTEYVVEYIRPIKKKPMFTISLLCADPFFYEMNDITVTMSAWVASFRFPHRFRMEPIGYRENVTSQNIVNDNAEENIGLEIRILANGEVTNPSIYHIEEDTHITIGTSSKPLTLVYGDELVITTGINNKHVYLIHSGTKTEINEYLTEDSEFIQLQRGNNNIGYGSGSGEDNMSVSIKYRFKYASA